VYVIKSSIDLKDSTGHLQVMQEQEHGFQMTTTTLQPIEE
jgi:hypothetical protein